MDSMIGGMKLIDNVNQTLRDDLSEEIKAGSKLSIAAACFSISLNDGGYVDSYTEGQLERAW